MGFGTDLGVVVRAASHVPLAALLAHGRRRLRNRLVPRMADGYRKRLSRLASALPRVGASFTPEACRAAETVSMFFAAKHCKNVPQCFEGRFTFLGETHDFGGVENVDWRVDMDGGAYQLWRANLSFMGYLCTAADHDPEQGLQLAATLCCSFRSAARLKLAGDFSELWNSYPVSQRILSLSALLIRLPTAFANRAERAQIEQFLRENVAFLLGNLETELGYNHLERNLSALGLYALAAGAVPQAIAQVLQRHFPHIVEETIGGDGVQKERSAMYQGFTIQSLRILQELDVWSADQSCLLSRRLAVAEQALAMLTLGDGQISLKNDAWFDETPLTQQIVPGLSPPDFAVLADAGCVRLACGDAVVLFDAGPIGADANPGHGHADFLSFEMSLGDARLVVDPGTPTYRAGAERDFGRSWQAHNGPCFDDGEVPVEYHGSFKVGRRSAARLDEAGEGLDGQRAAATLAFLKTTVSRRLTLVAGELRIEDKWVLGRGRPVTRFLVPSSWQACEAQGGVDLVAGGYRVRISVAEASIRLAPGQWSCRYNRREHATMVEVRPQHREARVTFTWQNTS